MKYFCVLVVAIHIKEIIKPMIEVYMDIDDETLRSEWERLEQHADAFPQLHYHWCSSWWKKLGRNRKPHVILVRDLEGYAVGVAPFFYDSFFGFKYLRSMPENYGDFYDFIVSPSVDAENIYSEILNYLEDLADKYCVILSQVNNSSYLNFALTSGKWKYSSKLVTKVVVTTLGFSDLSQYLASLKGQYRKRFKRRISSFEGSYEVTRSFLTTKKDYLAVFDDIQRIQSQRWDQGRPRRTQEYMELVRATNSMLFEKGKMGLLIVRADGRLAAYRIGILHSGVFYAWNTSYDTEFQSYSPGSISVAYLMEQLADRKITMVNFMAGFYGWKVESSPHPEILENHFFISQGRTTRTRLLSWYFLTFRDKIKLLYQRLRSK